MGRALLASFLTSYAYEALVMHDCRASELGRTKMRFCYGSREIGRRRAG